VEVEPSVLARIDQLRQAGASAHTIAAALNREGAEHPQQIRWHQSSVTQIGRGPLPPTLRRVSSLRAGSETPRGRAKRRPTRCSGHVIAPYASAADLTERLADGVQLALTRASAAVVVLVNDDHRKLLEAELERRGVDLEPGRSSGRYLCWDADTVLTQITIDGYVSARLFRSVVGTAVREAVDRHGEVHAFGELAGYLWERGEFARADAVEDHWNALIADLPVTLVCGYPDPSLAVASAEQMARIHRQHGETA
jgi:hypothetical protein